MSEESGDTGPPPRLVAAALDAQLVYYRRRAPEYDGDNYADEGSVHAALSAVLDELEPRGRTLEIACGTGMWTRLLARRVPELTALDAAPEMLEIARRRLSVGAGSVRFVEADAFSWRPDQSFETVFFGFWLSHVPPSLFDAFWDRLASLLEPGGRVLFFDNSAGEVAYDNIVPDSPLPSADRRLSDGSTHRIVKVLHDPAILEADLRQRGWAATVTPVEDRFLAGRASRGLPSAR